MDPFTHALSSYTLKRAAFPRVPRFTTTAMLVAGTIPDLDLLSAYFGPSAFLTFYRTYCHSLLAALLFSLLVTLPFLLRRRWPTEIQTSPLPVFLAVLAAAVLHLLMDVCQSAGVELLWPISARRFALDWVAHRARHDDPLYRLAFDSSRQRFGRHGSAHLPGRVTSQGCGVCRIWFALPLARHCRNRECAP